MAFLQVSNEFYVEYKLASVRMLAQISTEDMLNIMPDDQLRSKQWIAVDMCNIKLNIKIIRRR